MIEYIVKWAIVVSTGFGSLWPSYQLKQTETLREFESKFDSLHHAEAFYNALFSVKQKDGEYLIIDGLYKVESIKGGKKSIPVFPVDTTPMRFRSLIDTSIMEIRSIINVSNPTKTQTP